jgi:hypothetical protein
MKKLIAFTVVFALVAAGVAFAADLGVNVIGTVKLAQGNTEEDSEITGDARFDRLRIEGSGENDDGNFGAWIRFEGNTIVGTGPSYNPGTTELKAGTLNGKYWQVDQASVPFISGLAWWKPIDQFKLAIGGNPDGIYGKEGFAGWMFKQIANDTSVVDADQAWGADQWGFNGVAFGYDYIDKMMNGTPNQDDLFSRKAKFRDAFYGGFGGNALMLEIKPVDMFGLNLVLPYWGVAGDWGSYSPNYGKLSGVFKNITLQADVNLDFGNIALTLDLAPYTSYNSGYVAGEDDDDKIGGRIFLYFGLSAIDNLSLDVGIGFALPQSYFDGDLKRMDPLAIGVAAKYNINDQFGLKARVLAEFMGNTKIEGMDPALKDPIALIFDVLPFFSLSDSVTIFADIGINMVGATKYDGDTMADSGLGFHFNPYVQIGNEWGPSFFAGIKVWTQAAWVPATSGTVPFVKADKTIINWEVPIALHIGF